MSKNVLDEIDFGGCVVQPLNSTQFASPGAGLTSGSALSQTKTGGAALEYMVLSDSPSSAEPVPLLHGAKAPYHLNKRERPIHRKMLELAAKGYNNIEIADITRKSAVCVNNALRQPHSQQLLVNGIRDKVSADEAVVEVIRSNVVKAVETLAEIMDDTDAKKSDRIAAAEALLNRRYGKPNQPINGRGTVDLDQLSDAELVKMAQQDTVTTTTTQ